MRVYFPHNSKLIYIYISHFCITQILKLLGNVLIDKHSSCKSRVTLIIGVVNYRILIRKQLLTELITWANNTNEHYLKWF
jgi:hypothetical protein